MSERSTEPLLSATDQSIDPRRIRSFVGLVLGRLGPRAHGAVAGIFLVLLVAEHTDSLFMVTFALTAHRILTWIINPLAGRWSDRSQTSLGRRVPFMAGGLLIGGVCTALYTRAPSYWALVGLLVLARIAFVAYIIPAAAVTPEAFGNSRWLRAGAAVTVGGIVVGLSIRGTVIATWDQNDPSTWTPAYVLAAIYVIGSGLAIALLVREAPGTKILSKQHVSHDLRSTVRSVLAMPNAPLLLSSVLLANASGGAFSRAYPIYARDVLGAGGDAQAGGGIAAAVLACIAFPFGWWLAGRVSRKQTALWAGITGAGAALAHLWITELWQSIVLFALSGAFLTAAVISLVPLYLAILPRQGGLGERLGLILSPLLLSGMIAAFGTGLLFDVLVHDYRAVWIPTAVLGLAGGVVLLWLKLPPGAERADPRSGAKLLLKILWGRPDSRRLFRGELADHDVDGTALLERVADELNPYMQRD